MRVRPDWRRFCVLFTALSVSACAPSGDDTSRQWKGSSDSIAWEVTDIRKQIAPDGKEISWQYTIVLHELSGHEILFSRHRRSFQHENLAPLVAESEFRRKLAARSELQVPWLFREHPIDASHAVIQRGDGIQVWHRFEGSNDGGQGVTVDVRFGLD
jgi:hypothetical protein